MRDLFDTISIGPERETIAQDAMILRGFARLAAPAILGIVNTVTDTAPFRHMVTPGGFKMSVALTNCGAVGWVSDRRGYRYDPLDPITKQSWPAMPPLLQTLSSQAANAAGYPNFLADACLINCYVPKTGVSLHQDKNECDFTQPIVSFSFGLPAVFLFGSLVRDERPQRLRLEHGDVVVWGGAARLAYHGIMPLADGQHPDTGNCRINLTFRKAL